MKRLRLLSIILLLNCKSITATCQTTTDSCTCIPNAQLRQAAQLIERGKGYAQMYKVASDKNDSLTKRIEIKDQVIAQYQAKDSVHVAIEDNCKKENANLSSQVQIAVGAATNINKQLRKQKRKTVAAVLGTVAIAVGLHLLLK